MASSITDPYSFLSESEITTDVFSSSSSIFYHLDFEDLDKKTNPPSSEKSKYDFYNHIQTIHLDEETLVRLAPHRQVSQFIWSTSFLISEQSILFAIFIPFGIIIWKSKQPQQQGQQNEKESEFYQIKPVEKRKATFIDCINSQSLIFTYKGEKVLYIIHDAGNITNEENENSGELIRKCDLSSTVRTFCQLSPEKALIITDDNTALIFDVPSLTKLKTFTYNSVLGPILNPILKLNPIRNQNICDSIILTTSTLPFDYDEENDNDNENENYVISASYYHLSVFDNADNKDGSFTFRNTVETVIGKPKYVSVIGSTAFLMVKKEKQESDTPDKSGVSLLQIYDIYSESSRCRQILFDSNEEIITIIAVENDVCCILTRYHLYLIIASDITFQFSLVVSKSFNDFIFTGSLISDHTISILTAHEGNHVFEILPYDQLLRLIPYQVNRVLAALNLFQTENEQNEEDADYQDSVSLLEHCDIDKEAFYEADKQKIVSLTHFKMIQDFLKIHLDLVKLFYIYITKKLKEGGQTDDEIQSELKSINEFEINAYDLICFNETVLLVGDSVSFEYDVLRNAIMQRNLQTIFDYIKTDITSKHYNLLDFLINMTDSCFKEHYIPNEKVYLSTLKCHPQLKILIDTALHSFKGQYKLISKHIEQYTKLCSLSFPVLDEEENDGDENEQKRFKTQIEYAMELFKLDEEYKEHAISCAEQIALDHSVIELMAWILHITQLYVTKCNLYYDTFGSYIIMPILVYMLEQGWIADIFDIGEIPEWRPYATELLTDADSLLLAFHLITEEGDELSRAAELLWQSISNGIKRKVFTLDQAASLCSITLMCCTVKLNEDQNEFAYLNEIKQNAQDQFMLLKLQKTSKITDQNTCLTPNELMDYFIDHKDYIVALSVYGCSINERNEEQNASALANIISLLAISWKNPLTDGSLKQILVESRALENIPNGLFENLEKSISQFEKRNLVLDIVKSANIETIRQLQQQKEEQEEE